MIGGPDATALHHGGALDAAVARHGGARADWLDLSTGINPAPPALPPVDPALWHRLPEAALEACAIEAARRFYGASGEAAIVAAPGSQALISILPHLFAPTKIAILEPTYDEHRATFEAAGHAVAGFADLEAIPADVRIIVVVNPNNPDGRICAKADLLALSNRLAAGGGLLVVDEAFADPDPRESLAGETGRPGLLVTRSFGKFFGLAGLRLGFALTEAGLAARLCERLGPWAVSGPALAVGAQLMADEALVANLRRSIPRQADLLRWTLEGARLEIVGGTALFILVRHARAGELFEALCRRRILTRPFGYRPDWLRIGNPADDAQAGRLAEALREALEELGRA